CFLSSVYFLSSVADPPFSGSDCSTRIRPRCRASWRAACSSCIFCSRSLSALIVASSQKFTSYRVSNLFPGKPKYFLSRRGLQDHNVDGAAAQCLTWQETLHLHLRRR